MLTPITVADVWRNILNGAPEARRGDPLLLRAEALFAAILAELPAKPML